jgi:protease-4
VIWREVSRLRESGKPVVVSMGDVAASGGYYIACPAEAIVALPATLTGSIGVFGGKLVVDGLLERIGVSTGTVQQGERALMYSSRRGFSEDERARFAATIDAIYSEFVAKVAAGRKRAVAEIEAVARGRVWTGRDALDAGLVDELGGLRHAIRIARTRASLPDDAPVLGAIHIPPLARLSRPRNSDDPRTWMATTTLPGMGSGRIKDLADVAAALGLPVDATLRMPDIYLR